MLLFLHSDDALLPKANLESIYSSRQKRYLFWAVSVSKCVAPRRVPRKVEIVLQGAEPGQVRELHQPGAELDVVFDLVSNALVLRETIKDPNRHKTSSIFSVQIDCAKMRFINLIGLEDSSLLLSLRMRRSACKPKGKKMLVTEKFYGFAPPCLESRLDNDLYACGWSKQRLQLFLPEERIRGWKTVALILKTFKEITAEHWCHIVHIINPPPVSGLDWKALEEYIMTDGKKPSDKKVKCKQAFATVEETSKVKLLR
ncbi:uncharacterized protein ATNIH1004_006009 [Aspergillus tanneri]|uniref:Uncharacterized protein n=1 Tax=Aspergillus tanneri TaxID=1220188 RepID=A0A5M9MY14_9EURO|nr:uncharacterized protein ATNIH1004_006009 [Aspergillus tanneri]KAA8647317.1 hypothetical protein ATNIH1004_006009 [Aspergillus tanneri]